MHKQTKQEQCFIEHHLKWKCSYPYNKEYQWGPTRSASQYYTIDIFLWDPRDLYLQSVPFKMQSKLQQNMQT
jgi:hypothetical protein